MAGRSNVVTLGGTLFRLRQAADETRGRSVETVFVAGEAEEDFLEVLPFGRNGMGSSVFGIVPGEYHYGLDTDAREPGFLKPWYDKSAVTLTGAGTVTGIKQARDSSGTRYLYIANNSAKLFKVDLATIISSPTVYTVTFAHGSVSTITDVIVMKDGAAPGVVSRTVTQPAAGFILVMFGETAYMRYTDAIAAGGVDTFAAGVGQDAYGGVGAVMQGAAAGETYVFKSTAASGQTSGGFSRLQYTAISTGAKDYTAASQWLPTTSSAWQATYQGESITKILDYGRGPLVAQPSGLTQFDQNGSTQTLATFASFAADGNGKHMAAWGRRLVIPTKKDLIDPAGGAIGITKLMSNTSPITGYPTAFCTYGDNAFVSYYDGTDSYICELVPRTGQNVPQEVLIYPRTKLASAYCGALGVFERADGSNVLVAGNGTALAVWLLDPAGSRVYEGGGTHYLAEFGDPSRFIQLERATAYVSSGGSAYYWTFDVSLDGGSYNTLATWNSTGKKVYSWTPGTNDTCTFLSVRFSCTNGTNTNCPTLKGGAGVNGGGGGLILKGKYRRGEAVWRVVYEIEGGTYTAGTGVAEDRFTIFATFAGYLTGSGGTTPPTKISVVDEDLFGDTDNHEMIVENVRWIEGPGSSPGRASQFLRVQLRTLLGSTL